MTGRTRRSAALLVPAAAFILIFYVLPVLEFLAISVTEPSLGLENYLTILDRPLYWKVLRNTFEIAAVVAALTLVLGYPTALLISRLGGAARTAAMICVIVPFFTSDLVRNYAWIFLLGNRGVINSLLVGSGLIGTPLPLIFNRFAVVLAMVHILLPYVVLLLLDGLRSLDPRLARASASLGAGGFGIFRRVLLPLTRQSAAGAAVLVFVMALAFFVTPAMLGGPGETMIANLIASEMGVLRWGFAAALGALMLAGTFAELAAVYALGGGFASVAPDLAGVRAARSRQRPWSRMLIGLDRLVDPFWGPLIGTVGCVVLVFLILPVLAVFPLSLSPLPYFVFPPPGVSLQWFEQYFTGPRWNQATVNSLLIGLGVAAFCVAIALPAAFAIARSKSRATAVFYAVAVSPLVVPSIIVAVAVYFLLVAIGLNQTLLGVGLGQAISSLPPALIVLIAALKGFDWRLYRAAESLGASPLRATLKVALPLVAPAIGTAAFLAFLHSFNDLLVALFVSGLRTETLPKRMWESLEEVNPTIAAVSTLLIAATCLLMGLLHWYRHLRRHRSAPAQFPTGL